MISLIAGVYLWPAGERKSPVSPEESDEASYYRAELLADLEKLSEQELDDQLRILTRERRLDGDPVRDRSLPDIRTDPLAQLGRALF